MPLVIHDCDPGHDDAIALALALSSPEIELLGVSTVAGNQTLEQTTANAIRVLDHLGRDEVPVAAGAGRALVRQPHRDVRGHGETGLDGPELPPPARAPESEPAVDWMARVIADAKAPVLVVATGPLTNLALLLACHPEVEHQLARVVLMGGAIGEGNITPAAEFNIWCDPEAAARVFGSGLEVTMVGLDVTHKALMRPEHARRLASAGRAGRLVADLYEFYAAFHRRTRGWDGAPVHDALAMAHLIDATLLETRHCGVKVDTGGELSRGRTNVDRWGHCGWPANCHVAVDVDTERFLELLVGRIGRLG
jgi:pyrimidine-specific ribonucleoside hydrolase